MSEWWTYRPHDFLMFSPRIYWRLFESLNLAWWPLQPLLAAGLLALLWSRAQRWWPLLLALAWVITAWAFFWQRYAPIQWVAGGIAWAFAAQALGLLILSVRRGLTATQARWGLWIASAGVLGYPLLALLAGRPWLQAESWGLAPDPTALVTLALLLTLHGADPLTRWLLRLLWVVPLAWCAFSSATLAVMGSGQAWVVGGGALLLLGLRGLTRQRGV